MRGLPLVLLLLTAIAAPTSLVAQEGEDESPDMLRLSFYMCNTNLIDDAMEEVESQDIPVWNELVAEGMVESYGYFVHRWADEWNVGLYTVAESIDAVIKASAEAGAGSKRSTATARTCSLRPAPITGMASTSLVRRRQTTMMTTMGERGGS